MRQAFDYDKLHPKARDAFRLLTERLAEGHETGHTHTLFRPFEGYRSPEDQIGLVKRGVSKAGPWQSAHNYGLAVDYVPWTLSGWDWDDPTHDWKYLDDVVLTRGLLRPIRWDRPHVEHPVWRSVSRQLV